MFFSLILQTNPDPKGSKRHPNNNKDTQANSDPNHLLTMPLSVSLEASVLKGVPAAGGEALRYWELCLCFFGVTLRYYLEVASATICY